MRRNAGRKQVEMSVYETVCDQCGEVIDTSTPAADEKRIHLSWGVLDCWLSEDMPDGPVDPWTCADPGALTLSSTEWLPSSCSRNQRGRYVMSRSDRIEIYRDASGGYRFRLIAANGEIIATGESFTRRWSAKRAARRTFPGHPITYV